MSPEEAAAHTLLTLGDAVPVMPVPTPVAVNKTPTVFDEAPIPTKLLPPVVRMT